MSKEVLVAVAEGVEETELVATVDILRRGGIHCILAGPTRGLVTASRQIELNVPHLLSEQLQSHWDAIFLPGGMGGVEILLKELPFLDFLVTAHGRGTLIAAICAAPLILQRCGLLEQVTRFTSHPAVSDRFAPHLQSRYSEQRVVVDNTIITSRGPGTAIELGLHLVAALKGPQTAEAVNRGVLSHW